MTVKTLIEKLSHYNKNAIVRLHHREGEELLFALAFQNDDTTVVLETENDNDMREEIQARRLRQRDLLLFIYHQKGRKIFR